MNTTIEPKTGQWILLACPASMNVMMLTAIAKLAQGGIVRVIDCGNKFSAYGVARQASGRAEVLRRIRIVRAFTCHQVLALLEKTPATQEPFVARDLLRTFYDESVRPGERKWVLKKCIGQLERLQKVVGGLVSVHPPAVASPAAVELMELLEIAAGEVFYAQPAESILEQLRMF